MTCWWALPKLLAVIALCITLPAGAQSSRLWVGPVLGGLTYSGDLLADGEWAYRTSLTWGAALAIENTKRMAPYFQLTGGRFTAQRPDYTTDAGSPNTFTSTRYVAGELGLRLRFRKTQPLSPYVGAALGLLSYTPENASGESLRDAPATRAPDETYGPTSLMLPLQLGVEWQVNEGVHLQASLRRWVLFTDYLDNVGDLGDDTGHDALTSLQLVLFFSLADLHSSQL